MTALDATAVAAGAPYSSTETVIGPVSSGVTVDGVTQCIKITAPTLPAGAAYWFVYRQSAPSSPNSRVANNGSCALVPVSTNSVLDARSFTCGTSAPNVSNAFQTNIFPNGVNAPVTASTLGTQGQCISSATPAVCGGFINGLVNIPAGASSVVVNTSAVTASSTIQVIYDASIGAALGVTCNTTPQTPYISARTAGTSFTMSVASNFTTNPGCFTFQIIN